MSINFTTSAQKLGIFSAAATAILIFTYAITLITGLLSLTSPEQAIGDPMFTILEILIITMMPVMLMLMVAIHAWAPMRMKVYSLLSVIFMGILCTITSSLHFVVLTLSRQDLFANLSWKPLLLEFKWPSLVYTLDILGWDIFFPLSILFAAVVFHGNRLSMWIRILMCISGLLSFAGLIGVVFNDMQLRNIGIVGYVGVFFVVDVLLAIFFYKELAADKN